MENHIHILSDLHPDIALSTMMREIKASTSLWLKKNPNFTFFDGWASGYAAFTYAYKEKDLIINYIKNQQEHHKKKPYEQELMDLLAEHRIVPEMRYFP